MMIAAACRPRALSPLFEVDVLHPGGEGGRRHQKQS